MCCTSIPYDYIHFQRLWSLWSEQQSRQKVWLTDWLVDLLMGACTFPKSLWTLVGCQGITRHIAGTVIFLCSTTKSDICLNLNGQLFLSMASDIGLFDANASGAQLLCNFSRAWLDWLANITQAGVKYDKRLWCDRGHSPFGTTGESFWDYIKSSLKCLVKSLSRIPAKMKVIQILIVITCFCVCLSNMNIANHFPLTLLIWPLLIISLTC